MPKMPSLRLEGAAGNLLRAPLDDVNTPPEDGVFTYLTQFMC